MTFSSLRSSIAEFFSRPVILRLSMEADCSRTLMYYLRRHVVSRHSVGLGRNMRECRLYPKEVDASGFAARWRYGRCGQVRMEHSGKTTARLVGGSLSIYLERDTNCAFMQWVIEDFFGVVCMFYRLFPCHQSLMWFFWKATMKFHERQPCSIADAKLPLVYLSIMHKYQICYFSLNNYMLCFHGYRSTMCEGVQGHIRALNWGFRVQLKTK